jgi:low temperature requirement protein LtrA
MAGEESHKRVSTPRREEERVTPLELFFDLVFVLAITQCTVLMSRQPTWAGLAQGLLVLGALWWSWVGYAWLTSVVDPEEDAVRLSIFVAMAGLLIVSLCVPKAFENLALTFAVAYAVVRAGQIALFTLASRDDPALRRSVGGLAVSTAIGVALLVAASLLDGFAQGGLWLLAILADIAGPYVYGSEGWKLVPGHFAERHGLFIIIALGESIVAIGVAAHDTLSAGVVIAGVLGVGLAAALWWIYFDVVAIVSSRRLAEAKKGREQNELARDSYSYLHFPMVAGIVLVALGLKRVLTHVDDPLDIVPATALLGGVALYLLGHVAFRYRHIHTVNFKRLFLAAGLIALLPLAVHISPLLTVGIADAALVVLIVFETLQYGEGRARIRKTESAESPAT